MKLTMHDDTIGSITVEFDRWDGPQAQYKWTIIPPDMPMYTGSDLRMGASGDINDSKALVALVDFIGAFAESVEYTRRTGIEGDNLDLFPEQLQEWAYQVGSDQFSLMADQIGRED